MMPLNQQLLQTIDIFLEDYFARSQETGRLLAQHLPDKSQIRKLETLILSTSRFSEIKNFIKNQAGKERDQDNKWRRVAPRLLRQLDELEAQAHALGGGDPATILAVKLQLARGWAKQVVAHYLFELSGCGQE